MVPTGAAPGPRPRGARRANRPAGAPGVPPSGSSTRHADEGPAHPGEGPDSRRPPAEQTRDDTDQGWGEASEPADAHEDWLRRQRPPHWQ